MGVTIIGPNREISIGYIGFMKFRIAIAKLCPAEIRDHYMYLIDNNFLWHSDEEIVEEYDKKTEEIYEKYKKKYGKVINFLYACDCGAKFSYGTCGQLLDVIGDYDDDIVYGQQYNVTFKDLKNLLVDCYEHKKQLRWF